MEISLLSDRSVAEEDEHAFLTPTSRRKKRSLADRRAALRPWAIGIELAVVVTVAAVGAYRLAAGIDGSSGLSVGERVLVGGCGCWGSISTCGTTRTDAAGAHVNSPAS